VSESLYAMPRNLVLAASAGTGKTFALVGVVVHAFVRGTGGKDEPVDPARVVATTFSRKAAAEIRARVTSELERLASDPASSPYAPALRGDTVDGGSGSHEHGGPRALTDAGVAKRARRALARLPAARFGTLHGFATGIVRSYAVELGLGPGFDLATEADAHARAEDAIARALETRFASEPEHVRILAEASGGIDRLVVQLRRTLARPSSSSRA
jgi:ATP-dependent helicase/nuclease subunit A